MSALVNFLLVFPKLHLITCQLYDLCCFQVLPGLLTLFMLLNKFTQKGHYIAIPVSHYLLPKIDATYTKYMKTETNR